MTDEHTAPTQAGDVTSLGTGGATATSAAGETREIQRVGLLDLTGMKSPDDLSGITKIKEVGLVLVPEPLMAKLSGIPMENVGTVLPIPVGEKVKVVAGSLKLSGEALANPAGAESTLVVAGLLHATTPVEKVGYKGLIVAGSILAPVGSETAIGAAISRLAGTVIYYKEGARIFSGTDRFSQAFFELLADHTHLILVGYYVFEPDVTAEVLKQKVSEITLSGKLAAPRALIPLIQALAVEKQGVIAALEDEKEDEDEEAGG